MAVRRLDEVKVPLRLKHMARAVVTKEAIMKNRHNQLQALLGRIKELLNEDEVLIIATNDAFAEATKRKAEEKKPDEDFRFETTGFFTRPNTHVYYTTNATTTTATNETIHRGWLRDQPPRRQIGAWENVVGVDANGNLVTRNDDGTVTPR